MVLTSVPPALIKYWKGPDVILSGLSNRLLPFAWKKVRKLTLVEVDHKFLSHNMSSRLFPKVKEINLLTQYFEWREYGLRKKVTWNFAVGYGLEYIEDGAKPYINLDSFLRTDYVIDSRIYLRGIGWVDRTWYENCLNAVLARPELLGAGIDILPPPQWL